MEYSWFLITVTTITTCIITPLFYTFISSFIHQSNAKHPPGPHVLPIITIIIKLLCNSFTETEFAIRSLRFKFGPIFTFLRGSRPIIYVWSRSLAHEALVHKGWIFADRPKVLPVQNILDSNQHSINSAGYGPTWRILRRNLTSHILHPSRVRDYSHARKRVLDMLVNNLIKVAINESNNGVVKVMDHFRFVMFSLQAIMCFGERINEYQMRQIDAVHKPLMCSFQRFQVLNFYTWLTRIVFRGRWNELLCLAKERDQVLMAQIRARKAEMNERDKICYVDTLLKLELEDKEDEGSKRKLSEQEIASICSEFLTAGTDTISTTLQWIMANLVKYPNIKTKLLEEIKGVIGSQAQQVSEEDLSKMPYLKAVVLEGLRRHPPGHYLLPYTVTQEVELGGYTIPKNAMISFTVAEIGWDPEVWENPMEYKPQRFITNIGEESFDITCSREIKMMPFGAGRRICPGIGLGMLHLEYFVANLVWKLEWEAVDEVDLSEKHEITTVMKYPLQARISPRQIT